MASTAHSPAANASAITSDTTDHELARRAAQGDNSAFDAIIRRHNRLLYRAARSVLRDDAEAEDALQDAYVRAWHALHGFRADAKLTTWLTRIVINEALGRIRKRASAKVINIDDTIDSLAPPLEDVMDDSVERRPDAVAMRAETRRLIEACIDRLPDAFRTVFMLRAVEELSVEEVAQMLDIPEATVRTRFFRARSLMREGLARDIDVATNDAFSFDGERCDRIRLRTMARIIESDQPRGSDESV